MKNKEKNFLLKLKYNRFCNLVALNCSANNSFKYFANKLFLELCLFWREIRSDRMSEQNNCLVGIVTFTIHISHLGSCNCFRHYTVAILGHLLEGLCIEWINPSTYFLKAMFLFYRPPWSSWFVNKQTPGVKRWCRTNTDTNIHLCNTLRSVSVDKNRLIRFRQSKVPRSEFEPGTVWLGINLLTRHLRLHPYKSSYILKSFFIL